MSDSIQGFDDIDPLDQVGDEIRAAAQAPMYDWRTDGSYVMVAVPIPVASAAKILHDRTSPLEIGQMTDEQVEQVIAAYLVERLEQGVRPTLDPFHARLNQMKGHPQ